MDGLPRKERVTDPDQIKTKVEEAYRTAGYLLDDIEESALLVDALCTDCPIVGASPGFCDLTGYPLKHVLGQNCRMLLQGVPEVAVSRSARANLRNYCSVCQIAGLSDISEVSTLQPNARKDGSHFVNFFMLGLCKVRRCDYILGVQLPIGEGLMVQVSSTEQARAVEVVRGIFKRIRDRLRRESDGAVDDGDYCVAPSFQRQAVVAQPDFAFFAERLQDHCLLINHGFTAIRREPKEVAFNCLVFGDRPVQRTSQGLSFTVHVDEVTNTFVGLPILGFTKRCPVDEPGLYPVNARCLGSSVLVGACGEAFARDDREHFKMRYKLPQEHDVQTWALRKDLPPHKREPPIDVQPGDLLHCIYSKVGRIQMKRNDTLILDFDVGRPIDEDADYYAVVDVCFSTYSLTVMPSSQQAQTDPALAADASSRTSEEVVPNDVAPVLNNGTNGRTLVRGISAGPFKQQVSFQSPSVSQTSANSRQISIASSIEPSDLSAVVDEVLVKKSIKAAIGECKFMVTIADPRSKDCPLIAVSDEFESMTGYTKGEILGANCRFLNQGCDMDPHDLANLRFSSESGVPFTAVIPNRKKSGELFLNLLDLRGLTVATNPQTGEDLWFLIGIQADVTELIEDDVPTDHIADLQVVADAIRASIAKELSDMAVVGAARSESDLPHLTNKAADAWRLLREPSWRHDSALGGRQPNESPVAEALAQDAEIRATSKSTGCIGFSVDTPMAETLAQGSQIRTADTKHEFVGSSVEESFVHDKAKPSLAVPPLNLPTCSIEALSSTPRTARFTKRFPTGQLVGIVALGFVLGTASALISRKTKKN